MDYKIERGVPAFVRNRWRVPWRAIRQDKGHLGLVLVQNEASFGRDVTKPPSKAEIDSVFATFIQNLIDSAIAEEEQRVKEEAYIEKYDMTPDEVARKVVEHEFDPSNIVGEVAL